MARMVDLIREGAAPESMMKRAAQGILSLSPMEAIEILVVLAGHRELGAEAQQTLENWNERSLIEVSQDTLTPPEVIQELLKLHWQRPEVLAALCTNPALDLAELEPMASRAQEEVLQAMMRSPRVCNSRRLLELMLENPEAASSKAQLDQWLEAAKAKEAEEAAAKFLLRHRADVAREDAQPFELVAAAEGEEDVLAEMLTLAKAGHSAAAAPEKVAQVSMLQKIGRMRVGERIKLAMRGNREERMVLIRDRSKLVSLAVLESPKVNDSEMENFAAMKNIQEAVLRVISTKRSYIKNYGVVRALANNPKTPLDAALPLLAHLQLKDQKALAVNKNVNETIRKMALKIFREKTERQKDKE